MNVCNGLPQLTVPLPSRRDLCRFTLRPVTHTVQDLVNHLTHEDHGIDRVVLRTTGDGENYICIFSPLNLAFTHLKHKQLSFGANEITVEICTQSAVFYSFCFEVISVFSGHVPNLSVWITDGIRISSSDSIESLLMDDFDLLINDVCYRVVVPPGQKLTLVCCDPTVTSS